MPSRNRRPAPSGLVTFLFTDVEGSTRRWEAYAGETMSTAEMVAYAYDQIDQARTELEQPG
jgi:class 3 adenylate cyclase